jgi:hypothetical protein
MVIIIIFYPFPFHHTLHGSVGVTTSYRLDSLGFESWQRQGISSSSNCPDHLWGQALPYTESVLRLIPEGSATGHETDRSHPSSAKYKKEWSYTFA